MLISIGIAVLAAAVLLSAALVAVPLWTALVQGWRFQPAPDHCDAIQDGATRQVCRDKLRGESRHPAKGAVATEAP